jgi:pyridoxine 5-phosphate synthase
VHPRPDERHITTKDVDDLSQVVATEFNIEGYPDERFMKMIEKYRPAQATLVPDPPHVLTSNAGWDTKTHLAVLKDIINQLKSWGVRSSIFVDTNLENINYAIETGTDRIELYTGPYADEFHTNKEKAVEPFVIASERANELGLGLNAGHDLNQENLRYFKQSVSNLLEVSIGHALISDALYLGLENTIQRYNYLLRD